MTNIPRGAHCMANGIRHHYLDFNGAAKGPPILLLPGITSPAASWSFVAERLAETWRVVVPDIRGRGLSENRPGLCYSLDDYAQDAKGIIEALELKDPIVIGHSMGARIAARLGATAAHIASKLILVDPPLSGPARDPYPTPLSSYLLAIEAASRGATIDELRKYSPTWSDEHIAIRLQWLPTCSVEAITETHRHFHDEDVYPDFPRLTCPTQLIYATRSRVVTAEKAGEIVSLLANGHAVPVDAGHMVPWENLEDFLVIIRKFIAF